MPEIVTTSDNSETLYIRELDEHYHSVHGAVRESTMVYIENGYRFCTADPVRIFEVGFGTGLNVLLTLIESLADNRSVEYTSVEKYPLNIETACRLNYGHFAGPDGEKYFRMIHNAPWEMPVRITRKFTLTKIKEDFLSFLPRIDCNLVYYDAFGPDKQPEMWSPELFRKISGMVAEKGILVTYSSKGEVKRSLRGAGFEVTLLTGPPHKRHVIRAIKRENYTV